MLAEAYTPTYTYWWTLFLTGSRSYCNRPGERARLVQDSLEMPYGGPG